MSIPDYCSVATKTPVQPPNAVLHCPHASLKSVGVCINTHDKIFQVEWPKGKIKEFCDMYQRVCVDTGLSLPYDDCVTQASSMMEDRDNSPERMAMVTSNTLDCRFYHLR